MSDRTTQPSVLITGANGRLGRILRPDLIEAGWHVRSLVHRPPTEPLGDVVVGSVTDLSLMEAACEGVDGVVHLGGLSGSGSEWPAYLDTNINGTWTVLEAARRAGVRRVALASSNHAVGYVRRAPGELPAHLQPRPDSLYGVSKAAGEALGAFYADEHGLETTSLRIGSCFPVPTSWRMLSTWLSRADFRRLVLAALTGPWPEHLPAWGISRNTRRWWSLEAGERIGYQPEDDAEVYAAGLEPEHVEFVGGSEPPH